MKKLISEYWFFLLIAALIIVSDQITKDYVRQSLAIGETWMPLDWLAPYARFIHWKNTGVAFGMFQGMGVVFAVLAAIVSAALVVFFPRLHQNNGLVKLALGLMLGGAIGNLIDRITEGYVTDFISVGTFAVFNIADSGITVGTGLLIIGTYLVERRQKRDKDMLAESPSTVGEEPTDEEEPS